MVVEVVRSEKSGPMRVVEFNPWQWSGDEAITRAFFREITAALGDSDKTLKGRRRADEFRRYAKKLEQFSGGVKSASDLTTSLLGWLGSVGLLLAGAGLVTLDLPVAVLAAGLLGLSGFILLVSKILGWFGRDKEDDRPLDISRARLEDRLKSLPRNILVVIDDIDRLDPDEIRLVIRHVKANANLSGLTYLLLFQKDVVESAFDGAEKGSGGAYLEKIVQAAFDVPVVEGARIERFVLAELEKLASQHPGNLADFDAVRWGNIWQGGLRHFFRNLRDGRRFIGGIEVQLELHRGARVLEANMIDVVALEAVRLFEPKLFTLISRSKRLLTGSFENKRDEKEVIKQLFTPVSEPNLPAVKEVMKSLFPLTGWAFGGTGYGSDWEEKWDQERRICAARYFDRYFALRLPDGQISDSDFIDFVACTNDRSKIDEMFADYDKRNLLTELLDRLDLFSTKLPRQNADVLIPALFDIGEISSNDMGFSIASPFLSAWRACSWYLKSEPDRTERGSLFLRSLKVSKGLAVPSVLIGLEIESRANGSGSKELSMDDAQLEEAKSLWVAKLASLTEDRSSFMENQHFINYLYRWKEYAGGDAPRKWVESVSEQRTLLVKLLTVFWNERQSLTLGEYVPRTSMAFELNNLLPFIDLPSFVVRVRDVPLAEMNEKQQAAVAGFFKAAERYLAEAIRNVEESDVDENTSDEED